jgi:hypothetical protein
VNPPLRPGYAFQGTPLHWDMTLASPIRFGTQAILHLTDTAADHGAFGCVAGCHRWLSERLKQVPAGEDPREVARKEFEATPIKAGRMGIRTARSVDLHQLGGGAIDAEMPV